MDTSPARQLAAAKKRELRTELRAIGKALDKDEAAELSERIIEALEADPLFQSAKHIALYHALPDEPDLGYILSTYHDKILYLPRVEGDSIHFYLYRQESDLELGTYGIQEPKDEAQAVDPALIELILVPAMAFDREGYRLGRGKGFYDRFLPTAINATRYGITFGLREIDELPRDDWDTPVQRVYSSKRLA